MWGWGRGLSLASALAWIVLVGCDSTPAPSRGSGGFTGSGGAVGTGGRAMGGRPEFCPGDSCCPEVYAIYSCSGDAVCKSYSYLATDCSKHECGAPCPFGCADGRCLPGPTGSLGGAGGIGGGMGGGD